MQCKLIWLIPAALSCLLSLGQRSAAQPAPKPSELAAKIGELTKEKKFDEAAALVRAKAADPSPAAEVPLLMFRVAQWLYCEEKYDESLDLLKEITNRFPDANAASLAWCGMGQVYGRLGKNDEMIAALERGMSAKRVWTQSDVMDASDTHNFACEVLGAHYMKNRQWDKALSVYTAWKPQSWCGTCWASMEATRSKSILRCQLQLGRFDEAARWSWRGILEGSWAEDELGDFVLVRSYSESRQLDDLQSFADEFLETARAIYGEGGKSENKTRLQQSIEPRIEALSESIRLAKSKRYSDHIAVFQKLGNASQRHVATWVLMREHEQTVQQLWKAAYDTGDAGARATEILAAIDSPAAKAALKAIARRAKPARREQAASLIREHMPPSPEDETSYGEFAEDSRLPVSFYRTWPQIALGSLPTSLPADLFAENKR